MRILCFGSLNLDKVYKVEHFVKPGETLASLGLSLFCGGKGLNQSIALACAGCPVSMAGKVGKDGDMLIERLKEKGVDTSFVRQTQGESGHAVIQVDESGQNSILLFGGANREIDEAFIDEVLNNFQAGDFLLLQNEISGMPYIMSQAKKRGMIIVLNPSPMDDSLKKSGLENVDWFLLNEIEGEQLTGESEPRLICEALSKMYPKSKTVLTLGEKGSVCFDGENYTEQAVYPTKVVDTTAAGDTFTGYFLAGLLQGQQIPEIMDMASRACSITVSREGASDSIPKMSEVIC
ncbi:MAG: ribokinase [Oscillospiraceae bacterium]|nr:ribokinase [Oscillospiraceae bacterium]